MVKPIIPSAWRFLANGQQAPTGYSQFNTQPVGFVYSNNPNYISVDYPFIANFAEYTATIRILVTPNVGTIFALNGNLLNFSIQASPTPSQGEYYAVFGDNSFNMRQQVAVSIAYELNNNSTFNQYYTVEALGIDIIIKSRFIGLDANLTITLPSGMSLLAFNNSGNNFAAQALSQYKSIVEMYAGDWQFGQTIDRLNANRVEELDYGFVLPENITDVREALKPSLGYPRPFKHLMAGIVPKFMDNNPSEGVILKPFFGLLIDRYAFSASGQPKRFTSAVTGVFWVQNGATEPTELVNIQKYVCDHTNFNTFEYISDARPKVKATERQAHEYLQFILNNPPVNTMIGAEVDVRFLDGTTTTYFTPSQLAGLGAGNVSVDISPNVLNLDSVESVNNKTIYSYRVRLWIQKPSQPKKYGVWTEFKYQTKCRKPKKQLIWFNRYGGWDSFTFLHNSTSNERSLETFDRSINPFALFEQRKQVIASLDYANIETCSAVVDFEHFKHLEGMLKSPEVWTWDEATKKYLPVVVEASNFDLDNFNTTREFAFNYTIKQNLVL